MTLILLAAILGAPSPSKEFWMVDVSHLSNAEKALVQSVQGLANRKGPLVWQDAGGMSAVLTGQMKAEGWRERTTSDPWEVVRAFRGAIKGAALCRVADESLNRAATLAGRMDLLVVDEALEGRAEAEGIGVKSDVRAGGTPAGTRLTPGTRVQTRGATPVSQPMPQPVSRMAVEQPPSKPGHLRDFAIKHRALCFCAGTDEERRQIVARLPKGSWVLGWGPDEYRWIEDLSRARAQGLAADWCANLSAMESLGGKIRKPPVPTPEVPPKKGERVVAFVLSDGDNVQWLTGGMPLEARYYGSKLRGTFKMTWEVSPLLATLAPRVLDYLFSKGTPRDGFVAAGAPGYSYAVFLQDRETPARQTQALLKASGLRIVGVINANGGQMSDTQEILEQPNVDGVVYKDYAPYHGRHGAVWWHRGKPCISYRFSLWEGMRGASPEEVGEQVRRLPADPTSNSESYALVSVHAWSFGSIGGPMEAIRRAIAALPPGTRVVTAPELVGWLRRYCAPHARS